MSAAIAVPKNISPTRTVNLIHDPQGIINFLNRSVTGFGIQKLQAKFELKDSKNIYYENFEF